MYVFLSLGHHHTIVRWIQGQAAFVPKTLEANHTIFIDPQGQGRETARKGAQGGNGRQTCKDQGGAREETRACVGEEAGFDG